MKRIISIIVLLSAITVLLCACGSSSEKANAAVPAAESEHAGEDSLVTLSAEQVTTAGIVIGAVEQKQLSGTLKASGMLDVPPQQKVSISVPIGGFLRQTDLLEGKKVSKGEIIAVMENPEYIQMQQDYLDAISQLEYAQVDFERQSVLDADNINARKTLQQAKASYQSLKAKVAGLKERIISSGLDFAALEKGKIQSSLKLYAPISGWVTRVNVNIGKYVNPADVLFEIVDTEHLHAELTIFEKDVPKLKVGQKVRFMLANETTERSATVYLVGREISQDRTVHIHCHIDKEDTHLLPGLFLKAIVETGQSMVPALPDEAILDFEGQPYVFVPVKDKQFRMVPVQTGIAESGFTEIILPEGVDPKAIVTKGAYALLSKLKNSGEEE